jgi:hypothetical protein
MNISGEALVSTQNFLVSRSNGDPPAPPNRGVVNQTGGVVTVQRDFVLGQGDPLDDARYNLSGGFLLLGTNGMSLGQTDSTGIFTLSGTGFLNGSASHLDYAGPLGSFVMTGGEMYNVGTVNFALNQGGGKVEPGDGIGQMTVNGNYAEALAGSLQIEMNGTGIGTGHDNLTVNGLVTLSGGLDVVLGFAPTLGQTFEILSNDSIDPIIGSFAGKPQGSTFLTDFGGTPYAFQISYFGLNGNGNDVVLRSVAVPEPSTIVLGALGLLGLWSYSRRRRRAV